MIDHKAVAVEATRWSAGERDIAVGQLHALLYLGEQIEKLVNKGITQPGEFDALVQAIKERLLSCD